MIIENVIKADVCKNKSANAVGFSLIDDMLPYIILTKGRKNLTFSWKPNDCYTDWSVANTSIKIGYFQPL